MMNDPQVAVETALTFKDIQWLLGVLLGLMGWIARIAWVVSGYRKDLENKVQDLEQELEQRELRYKERNEALWAVLKEIKSLHEKLADKVQGVKETLAVTKDRVERKE